MKKHEVVLDFTSLLDVILIILFLVLCTMNGKAQKDSDKIDELTQAQITMAAQIENQAGQIEELENTNKEQAERLEEMEAVKKENDRLQAERDKMEAERDDALHRLDKYMEITGLNPSDSELFEIMQGKMEAYTIRLVKKSYDDNNCYLYLYDASGKAVGQELSFDPLPAHKDENKMAVFQWLSTSVKPRLGKDTKIVVVEITYKYDVNPAVDVANSAPEHVKAAIEELEKDKSKGYIICCYETRENK